MTPSVRLPVEPLLELSGMSEVEFAKVLKTNCTRLNEYRSLGGFTPSMADRMAARIHLTPGYVWGDLWWSLPEGACGLAQPRNRVRDRTEEQRQHDVVRNRRYRARMREQRTQGQAA